MPVADTFGKIGCVAWEQAGVAGWKEPFCGFAAKIGLPAWPGRSEDGSGPIAVRAAGLSEAESVARRAWTGAGA